MPRLEIDGLGVFEVEEDRRLVLAIEEDAEVDIQHQCGSYAHCATCRVEFLEGEPEEMTQAEFAALRMRDLVGKARLSCQILCEEDMKVRPLLTVSGSKANTAGGKPEEENHARARVDG